MTDERALEVTTYSSLVSTVSNTLDNVNNDQHKEHNKIRNKNKMKLQVDICQPVSVVLERLSQEVYKKDLNSREKKNNQSQFEKGIKRKYQQEEEEKERERYKLRNKTKKHITRQNFFSNDTTISQVFQNRKPIDTWKYKRKFYTSSSEESVITPDISKRKKRKRRRSKLKIKQNNKKPTVEKLLSHPTYSNITNTKVILTKLEDMHDNKYVNKWKKKIIQTALTKNLECSKQYKNLSTSKSSINTMTSSHEDIIENNENNANAKESLSSYDIKQKSQQSKNLRVVLVKLELLGVSFEKQNLASKIEQLTANSNNVFKYNSVTYPNNILSNSSESNIINNCKNEALVNMTSTTEENDIVNQHPTNKTTMDTSLSDSILEDISNSKELSKKSESMEHDKSTGNVEIVEIVESIENVENLEHMEIVKNVENAENAKMVENVETVENSENVGNAENVEVSEQPMHQTDKNPISPKPVENLQNIDSLTETSVNNRIKMVDSTNNVIVEAEVSNTNVTSILRKEIQKISELNSTDSDVMNSESIEQSIRDSFLYKCIACNSSFKEFQTLPLHLKKCLAKSQERKNAEDKTIKCNVSDDSVNITEIPKSHNTSKSSVQQHSSISDSNNKLSPTLKKKLLKGKWKKLKHVKEKLENQTNVQCTVCSEVFETMESLSDHIYRHTASELQEAFKIAKVKQASVENSEKDKNVTTDLSKETQSATSTTKANKVKERQITTEQRKPQMSNVTSEQKKLQVSNITTEQEKLQVDKDLNTSPAMISESHKQMSNLPTINYVSPVAFCDCHKPKSNEERCIELVLYCSICKIIFRSKECFEVHLEKAGPYSCKSKVLMGTIQRLYCNACQIILYSFVDMRRHTENHIKNNQYIKLFCHICKVRFIGVGPIFNLHWFNHMRNLSFVASISNFPKTSLVDSNSKIWSLISSDDYNYLIVTEHVCNFCNEQFFATSQLQNHVPVCPQRKNVELSRAITANSDKGHNIDSELNLRLFCAPCKVMFKEKSLFETHAVSHKQHLQPQYICLSMTDIKRMYICNVCANVYENLKEFKIHWQDHNAIRETFMCYGCKGSFSTLETFMDHSKQCDISSIPVHMPSCHVNYYETNHNCKICNIGFESDKALYQHSGIHNIKFKQPSIVCSNEAQSKSIVQKISIPCPKIIQTNTEQLTVTSDDSIMEITMIDNNVSAKKDNTPEVSKNTTDTCTQSKPSTESMSEECLESEINSTSVNDNVSITDADTEILSPSSDVGIDNLSITQESSPASKDTSNDSIARSKENEVAVADNVSLSKKVSVIHANLNKKTDSSEIPSSLKNLEINETDIDDDVMIIEPEVTNKETKNTKSKSPTKVPEKNNDTSKEATSDPKSNDSSKSKEKPVEVPKYLRVKKISELMDQKLQYICHVCGVSCSTEKSLEIHLTTHEEELPISSNNVPILLPNFLSGGALSQQNAEMLSIQNPSNLQQDDTAVAPNVPIQPQMFLYSVPQVTQQSMFVPLVPAYTVSAQNPNVRYVRSRSNVNNANTATNMVVNTAGAYVPSTSVQPQNFYRDNQILLNVLTSSNSTNSPTNVADNNNRIQTSNKDSTTTLSKLLSTNNVAPTQAYVRTQPQDTHSRIKLQNAIHQKCSDKTPNVTAAHVIPKPVASFTSKSKQTPSLPTSSSNQYNLNENSSGINSSAGVTKRQKNNPMTVVNTNNARRMSSLHQTSTGNSNVMSSSTQRHTVHHKPAVLGPIYKCYYCPQIACFSTTQQLNEHLNLQHNYLCETCNERMFSLEELILHKLKHNAACAHNTFQS